MKKTLMILGTLLAGTLAFAEMTGYEIAKKADEIPEPKTSSANATIVIHSKKGKERVREVVMKSKDYGDVKKEIIVFVTPKDVSGTGYLMFDYEDENKDSDNWLYLPSSKKTRRIASSGTEGEGSFMGTDFTYDDMDERSLNKDDYKLLGEEKVDGTLCYKVEAVSKAKTEKDPRRILYFGKDDFVLRKCEFFDRQNQLHRILTCPVIEKIDGFFVTKKMKMENVQTGGWSTYEMKNVVLNGSDVNDNMFTVASLERGSIR